MNFNPNNNIKSENYDFTNTSHNMEYNMTKKIKKSQKKSGRN